MSAINLTPTTTCNNSSPRIWERVSWRRPLPPASCLPLPPPPLPLRLRRSDGRRPLRWRAGRTPSPRPCRRSHRPSPTHPHPHPPTCRIPRRRSRTPTSPLWSRSRSRQTCGCWTPLSTLAAVFPDQKALRHRLHIYFGWKLNVENLSSFLDP